MLVREVVERTCVLVCSASFLTACSARIEVPQPPAVQQVEQFSHWASERAEPYGIPERALQSYAFAAWKVEQENGCTVGWPTLAALGKVLADHGRAQGAVLSPDGTTSVELRGLGTALKADEFVADTDGGDFDANVSADVPVGPLQIMPSRWEQFGTSTEPGKAADPDDMDDAALTAALIMCQGGDMSTPEGWDRGLSAMVTDMERVKEIHAAAKEYSR